MTLCPKPETKLFVYVYPDDDTMYFIPAINISNAIDSLLESGFTNVTTKDLKEVSEYP